VVQFVEDDTESDDTTSSVLTWQRRTEVGEVQVLSLVGNVPSQLPDMVQSLGEKDSSLSKVMVIEMLGIYYTGCRTVKKQDVHTFETYKSSQEHGIGPNARFKLMDPLSTIKDDKV
jgi:hypothetical protein